MSFSRRIEALVGAGTSKTPSSPVNEPGDGVSRGPPVRAGRNQSICGGEGATGFVGASGVRCQEPRVGGGGWSRSIR